MLLDDDVVTDRQAESCAFPGGFSREEGIEYLLLHLGGNTSAVVAYPDLHPIAKVFGCGRKGRLVIIAVRLRVAFGRRIKPI